MPLTGSVAVLKPGANFVAVFINRAFIWSGVRVGLLSIINAAAPLTIGAAMLVPLSTK